MPRLIVVRRLIDGEPGQHSVKLHGPDHDEDDDGCRNQENQVVDHRL
jgi:hypothetical protein